MQTSRLQLIMACINQRASEDLISSWINAAFQPSIFGVLPSNVQAMPCFQINPYEIVNISMNKGYTLFSLFHMKEIDPRIPSRC